MSVYQKIKQHHKSSQYLMRCIMLYLLLSNSCVATAQTSATSLLDSLLSQQGAAPLAEPEQALSLESAISLALESNPTLGAARREIEAVDKYQDERQTEREVDQFVQQPFQKKVKSSKSK